MTAGFAKPVSQDTRPQSRTLCQKLVTRFNKSIKKPFGMDKISVKNIIELKIKNIVNMGQKIRLPNKLAFDIGIPHATSIGRDTKVAISCACKNERAFFFNLFSMYNTQIYPGNPIYKFFQKTLELPD